MEKIPVLVILLLVAIAVAICILGYKVLRIVQTIGTFILIVVFSAFLARIFRPSSL